MRTNASFRYKTLATDPYKDENGYLQPGTPGAWVNGIECMVEAHLPAKQIMGVDGQLIAGNYSVYIEKYFEGDLSVAQDVEITFDESGKTEIANIKGIDLLNRKYIELLCL